MAVYSEPKGDMVCMFQGQQGGITHIAFSPDGNKLYTGARKVMITSTQIIMSRALCISVTEWVPLLALKLGSVPQRL